MSNTSSVATNQKVSVNFLDDDRISDGDANGFYLDGKKISCMYGFEMHSTLTKMAKCHKVVYNAFIDRLMFFMDDGSVILWNDVTEETITLAGYKSYPQYFIDCYYDDNHYPALICGDKLHIFNDDGTVESKKYLTEAYCCVYHYGRMFDVMLDDDYEFCWTVQGMKSYGGGTGKAGFMCVPKGAGRIKRMFSLVDRIVILREFGINVMRGLADTRNFILDHGTIMLGEKLIENATLCTGKTVWFCTKRYLYSFDGVTLTQREHGYGGDNDDVVGIDVIDARYIYLSVNKDGLKYLVRYDPLTDQFVRFARNCRYICSTPRGLFTIGTNNMVGNLIKEKGSYNSFTFKKVDFGNDKYKTLKRIVMVAEPTVKLKVSFNGLSYTYLSGEFNNLNLTAKSFDFSLSGYGEVYELKGVWEVYK